MNGWDHVDKIITDYVYDEEALRFKTISEFKNAMRRGAEIQFEWKGVDYCAFGMIRHPETGEIKMLISQGGTVETNKATAMWADTPDEILTYMVGSDCLRDVITHVSVIDRTL